jgi:hypothetical protein
MLKWAWIVLAVPAVVILVPYLTQRSMIFPAPPASFADPATRERAAGELVWLDLPFGRVETWFLPATDAAEGPAPLLIYTHGNGELIDFWANEFTLLRASGMAVLLVEYPGYGRSGGKPSERTVRTTMLAAYDRFANDSRIDATRIAAYGRSLGGGAAAQLARHRPVRALILESSFTSVADMARRTGAPRWLVRDPFDSVAVVRAFRGPILVLHGRRDTIIPVEHGRALAAAAQRATLHEFDCGHNDCEPQWELVRTFLLDAGVLSTDSRRLP